MAGKNIPALLVTANVGSIFEDPSVMLKIWTQEFLQTVARLDPKFIAVHCQEVGGKNYEQSMKHVEYFVRLLMSSEELRLFDKVRIYLDEDFSSAENFTALGNFYFIHESVTDVLLWDFVTSSYVPAEGKEVHSGNIEAISTKEKAKFPQDFFPSCKWSRKGFLRTRWNLNGTVFDLINIHLFHDASNFVAMEMFPSVYCKNRRRALEHTLDRFHTDSFGTAPFFVFGDFNFRTDTKGVVNKLAEGLNETRLQSQKTDHTKMQYHDENSEVIFSLGKKEFSHHNHQNIFGEDGKWLKEFDRELDSFAGRLYEFPISFGPSYPYEENENGAKCYMKTRCPSWCDRIVLSNTATSLVNNINEQSGIEYDIMGANTCMGDHKPVYLRLELVADAGTVPCCPPTRNATSVCLNGLSHTPVLDTLTLPRASYMHDEPYTPDSMDTPSPLPSPLPSDVEEAQRTFNVSLTARLRQQSESLERDSSRTGDDVDEDEDDVYQCHDSKCGSDLIESPFTFLADRSYRSGELGKPKSSVSFECEERDGKPREANEGALFDSMAGKTWNKPDLLDFQPALGSPRVLVTQYVQEESPDAYIGTVSSRTETCADDLFTQEDKMTSPMNIESTSENQCSKVPIMFAKPSSQTDLTSDITLIAGLIDDMVGDAMCKSNLQMPSKLLAPLEDVDKVKEELESHNQLSLIEKNRYEETRNSLTDVQMYNVIGISSEIDEFQNSNIVGEPILVNQKDLYLNSGMDIMDTNYNTNPAIASNLRSKETASNVDIKKPFSSLEADIDKSSNTANSVYTVFTKDVAEVDCQMINDDQVEFPIPNLETIMKKSSATILSWDVTESSCHQRSISDSENSYTPPVYTVDAEQIESQGDVAIPKKDPVHNTQGYPESGQHFPSVKRSHSHSTSEIKVSTLDNTYAANNTVSPDEDDMPSMRSNRCFSDASGLRHNAANKQVSRVKLITSSDSLTRLQSHHSSSDEDWFEEDNESNVARSVSKSPCITSSNVVCEPLLSGISDDGVHKADDNVLIISPPFELPSSLSVSMIGIDSSNVLLPYSDTSICMVDSNGHKIPTESFDVLRIFKKNPPDLDSSKSQVCGASESLMPMLKSDEIETEILGGLIGSEALRIEIPENEDNSAAWKYFTCGCCTIL